MNTRVVPGILGLAVVAFVFFLISSASGQNGDPVATIGRKLDTILRRMDGAASPDQRRRVLVDVVGRLEALLIEVRGSFHSVPGGRAEQERIEFHLRYLITWTRFLAQKSQIEDPGETEKKAEDRPDSARARAMLQDAAQYEKDHPEDRTGIVDRYLKIVPLARGTEAEEEVVRHLNRVWGKNQNDPPEKGVEEKVDPGKPGPSPEEEKAAAAEIPKPAPKPEPKPEPEPGSEPTAKPATKPKEASGSPSPATPAAALTPEALKALREEMVDGEKDARIRAARQLATVDQTWVGKFLVDRLAEETDGDVQKELVRIVAKLDNRHVVRTLERWARFKDERLRCMAVDLLGAVGNRDAGKALTAFVSGEDLGTIRHVVKTAKKMPDGHGVVALARAAQDFPGLRFEVIEALGETRQGSAARVLISFLHRRKYAELKDPAMRALRMLGPNAIDPLIDALQGRDYRQYAAAALRSVTGERFGMSASRWQQWWRQNRKRLSVNEKQGAASK